MITSYKTQCEIRGKWIVFTFLFQTIYIEERDCSTKWFSLTVIYYLCMTKEQKKIEYSRKNSNFLALFCDKRIINNKKMFK